VLNEVCLKYIPVCKAVSKRNHNKNYPKSISNKLKEKHRAWIKMKHSNNSSDKCRYRSIAKECSSLIYSYDRDREQKIVDSRNLGKFLYKW
jgi:hypothetical protein